MRSDRKSDAPLGQAYLEYHKRLFELLGLDETVKIILHLGGAGKGKSQALKDARRHIEALSPWARERIALENDDRVFHVGDVVQLAEETGVPVAFDWHHHWVNYDGQVDGPVAFLEFYCPARFFVVARPAAQSTSLQPKSPDKSRAHADYVDVEFLLPFFKLVAEIGVPRLDVMVEAKMKDLAALRLRDRARDCLPAIRDGETTCDLRKGVRPLVPAFDLPQLLADELGITRLQAPTPWSFWMRETRFRLSPGIARSAPVSSMKRCSGDSPNEQRRSGRWRSAAKRCAASWQSRRSSRPNSKRRSPLRRACSGSRTSTGPIVPNGVRELRSPGRKGSLHLPRPCSR